MLDWTVNHVEPERVIDPGAGSGRFVLAAARRFPKAKVLGLEIDPVPALWLEPTSLRLACKTERKSFWRTIVAFGFPRSMARRCTSAIRLTSAIISSIRNGRIGSQARRRSLGRRPSQLAGLHAYFFLATARSATAGDFGTFITAAEWLDVNYGSLIRDLFLTRLGGRRIVVIEPTAMPFPDAATTAAVTYFEVGSRSESIELKRIDKVDELSDPTGHQAACRERLMTESRWSHLTRIGRKTRSGYVELGELCRVHRGQVTGANRVWVAGPHSEELPASVLFPTVTRAMELFRAGNVLSDSSFLRRVIDIPVDLSVFDPADRRIIERFLKYAQDAGAHLGYVASMRKAWWSVGLRSLAPILATYMARRPPAFVLNSASARHINIAHGLYPREPLDEAALKRLVQFLSTSICQTEGRTYAGGLTKFEPREMERLLVPDLRMTPGCRGRFRLPFGPVSNWTRHASPPRSFFGGSGWRSL